MEFKDLSTRFKATREGEPGERESLGDSHAESLRIRAKMVGVLLRDARVQAGRSLEDCARLLSATAEQIEHWELGEEAPSLPQLELLAYYLDVPVSHFWGTDTFEATHRDATSAQSEYLALRDRMIGALLRLAREQRGLSQAELAEHSGLPADLIDRYELGEATMPLHELSILAHGVDRNMSYFLEQGSHLGAWLAMREQWEQFSELPDEIRKFVSNPLNAGFIEIAIMLSQMPADRLRRVGESILGITM
jgi:transcriptional regulator with XRE-family HTH domain